MADIELPPDPPSPGNSSGSNLSPSLDIIDELRDSYLTYAQSVLISRALPDVRDGLKPSQRRILVAMLDLNLNPGGSTSKCSGIIGETMKRYHPHGDSSIYDALVRMAQDWVMRYKLIHGQGNFGSIAGLPPAAHRYTEAKLSYPAGEMLDDLQADTVDFIDSYDVKHREPLVLPSRFPNLLVNGADGIAVGMATDIPPHNLREICAGLIRLIEDPELSHEELLSIVPGPDFPTGGTIMGRSGIIRGYLGERSRLTLRAKAEIVEEGRSSVIIIREVPFQVTRNRLMESIGELVREDRIKDISAVRDESSQKNGEPVRIVIELKRNADPHTVLNQLYQFSPLQTTISIALLALVDGRPQFLSLKAMMLKFLDHRLVVIRRRTMFYLREAKRRSHILEGQLIALSALDEVIRICRHAPSRNEAKLQLQEMVVTAGVLRAAIGEEAFEALAAELGLTDNYRMTEAQAEAVVRMQLGQLAALESGEILKEYNSLRVDIKSYEELLADDTKVFAIIRGELEQMAARYGDNRRTEISDEGGEVDYEQLVPEEPTVVTISHEGFIKRMPVDTYRVQNRGGKGVSAGARENDFIEHFFVCSTHAYLLCFTDRGQVYWLRVFQIPAASRIAAGRAIANVLSLKPDEKITSVIPVRQFEDGPALLMATRNGIVKKTPLTDYSRPRAGGIIGIALEEGDQLIDVCLTRTGDEVVLSTSNGMAIRFSESDAREMGRNTRGVKGINLATNDALVGMVVADPEGYLLTVCENGYGKRTPFGANTAGEVDDAPDEETTALEASDSDETEATGDRSAMRYRKQRRGGKGLRDIRTSDRNGKVVGILDVRSGDEIMLITMQGMVTRTKVDAIRVVGRNTQGVKLMNLNIGDKIVTVAKVARETLEETVEASQTAE